MLLHQASQAHDKENKVVAISNSVERSNYSRKYNESASLIEQKNGSKILIQNFLDNFNHKLDENQKTETPSKRDNSLDNAFIISKGFNCNIGMSNSSLRKSYDQQSFPKMMQEDPYKKYQISSYQERRNMRLKEKSSTRTEASQGRNKNESIIKDEDQKPVVAILRKSYEFSSPSNFINQNSLSFNSKPNLNKINKQDAWNRIESNLKWAIHNIKSDNDQSEKANKNEIEKMQNSIKSRIDRIFIKDASAVPVISPDKEIPF